jgi:hypothetical protein
MSSEEQIVTVKLMELYQRLYVNGELPDNVIQTFRNDYPDVVKIWDEAKNSRGPYQEKMKELYMTSDDSEAFGNELVTCGYVSRKTLTDWQKEKSADQNPTN